MRSIFVLIFLVFTTSTLAQKTISELLHVNNKRTVPYISVQELAMPKTTAIILDAREASEYNVSHIKNAIYIGYTEFNIDFILNEFPNKNATVVVYCSLGIRSEIIAEKIKKAGYTNVLNLYGGLFEWKNNDFPIYNSDNEKTEKVHAFSKRWSKWLLKGEKVYE